MNQLPNWENAIIPPGKLEDYCLNPFHAKGKDKARVFNAVLGFSQENASELKKLILDNIGNFDGNKIDINEWGEIWRVDIILKNDYQEIVLRTNWVIRNQTTIPSLVSCFIKV